MYVLPTDGPLAAGGSAWLERRLLEAVHRQAVLEARVEQDADRPVEEMVLNRLAGDSEVELHARGQVVGDLDREFRVEPGPFVNGLPDQ
jgi:hypothetical protein